MPKPTESDGQNRRVMKLLAVTRMAALIVAGIIGVTAGLIWLMMSPSAVFTSSAVSTSGQALIRSDFELVNHHGDTVTDKSFSGQWQLVFFGFTYCPDVCPTTLAAMGAVLDQLGEDAAKVAPLFITVDPERDTPEVLTDYIAAFHPRIVGLTGTKEQVQAAVRSFRVFAARIAQTDAPDGYLMNHSGFIYLMRPNGEYETHFTEKGDPAEKIVAAIRSRLK